MRHLSIAVRVSILAALLVPILGGCVPGAGLLAPPTFSVVHEATLVRLEPPGVGRGAAVVRIELEATNPNAFGMQLAGLDGDFYLDGRRVAGSRFAGGVSLPAHGSGRLTLEVDAPLAEAPHLVSQLVRLLAAEPVSYRLEGTAIVEVLGTTQRLPSLTLAAGALRLPEPLRPPTVRFDASASGVRIDGLTARIEIALAIDNPTLFGYMVRGPDVQVRLDDRTLGRAALPPTPVPAFETTHALVTVDASLPDVGVALMTQLQGGGGGLEVALSGDLGFELVGMRVASRTLDGLGGALD